jgi:carbon-monoxide dehydrogenase large subunit
MHRGIGDPVLRVEDARLLTGRGRYSDDRNAAGQACAVVVRSPHAHAHIRSIDIAPALAVPGVVAVLTGADWLADGLAPMPAWGNPKDVELKNRDGRPVFYTPLYPIVTDKVRRVGEPVALVVAETLAAARDAAEQVAVDYDPLPAAADALSALEPGTPQLWDEVPGNLSVDDEKGDRAAVDSAMARAVHVVRMEFRNNRVTGVPMEPRAALADVDAATGRLTLHAGGQGANRFQQELCQTFGLAKDRLRVVSEDVGGGYGTRNHTYIEFALVLWAAQRLGRPVKWTCGRGEAFVSDYAGRDLVTRAELALDADGRILALRTENIANIGSHTVSFVPIARGPTVGNGVYHVPAMHVLTRLAFSNTLPVVSYRGAGRPESMFVIERLLDAAAAETGIDRIELRRRNIIAASSMPYTNPVGVTYDSGDYPTGMERVLALAGWDGFPERREDAARRGRLAGIGLCNYIETATGYPRERAEMEILPDGTVDLVMGTQSSGQGHETSFAQVVSAFLGVPFESVRLRTGDTDFVKMGSGSHSSRSMRLAGHLYRQAADAIIERGRAIAAHLLEVAAADIAFVDGHFVVAGTDRGLSLFHVAGAATGDHVPENLRGRLRSEAEILGPLPAYPNGCHVAEVEIDPDTGVVEITGYWGVDDVGTVINPMIVDGQTHGGIAQGAGQALMEECTHDLATAQVVAGSFMDYAMPRADMFPPFTLAFNEVPAPSTKLGVKGGGEGGTTGAPPALINAIVDALRGRGVTDMAMPATPERVWRALRRAG